MYVLGLNAAFHDSAACLVEDGRIVAAAEEERFTRIKHAKRPIPFSAYELPFHAVHYCLSEADIHLADINHIAYSFDPYQLPGRYRNLNEITLPLEPSAHPTPTEWQSAWEPLFLSLIVNAPRHLKGGIPHHLQKRFGKPDQEHFYQWHFIEHHLAHAASAFHVSPFEKAAVLTLDGRGEKTTTFYGLGEGTHLERLGQVEMPHSLGLLYEEVTRHLGFLHASDEYKVMALSALGKPRYLEEFREIVRIHGEGQYEIGSLLLEERFGPQRLPGENLQQHHFDVAHSLQTALEETVLAISHWLAQVTQSESLCLAGGVALNCVLNSRLRDRGPFQHIWVQPAAGDAGTALGAAVWVDSQNREERESRRTPMNHTYLGPGYSDEEIESFLKWSKQPYRRLEKIAEETAQLLVQEKIVAWFQGRMEFGPRALGARSILASPLYPSMQQHLNELKDREDFRPVAPVVLEEEASKFFQQAHPSPFMLFVDTVLPQQSECIPAACHQDRTARLQTVRREQNSLYYDTIQAFQKKTGVPVVINTSFNSRGQPIVCSPRDAVECFWSAPIDALVIGSFLMEKSEKLS